MSVGCKYCGCFSVGKSGIVSGRQRHKCKSCNKNFREGDSRVKHGIDKKIKILRMYLEGAAIRSIERLEGVSSPLIIHWIRQISNLVRAKLLEATSEIRSPNISILDVDQLFSYCQKNSEKFMCGLL